MARRGTEQGPRDGVGRGSAVEGVAGDWDTALSPYRPPREEERERERETTVPSFVGFARGVCGKKIQKKKVSLR